MSTIQGGPKPLTALPPYLADSMSEKPKRFGYRGSQRICRRSLVVDVPNRDGDAISRRSGEKGSKKTMRGTVAKRDPCGPKTLTDNDLGPAAGKPNRMGYRGHTMRDA
jgi:hypothetical protein